MTEQDTSVSQGCVDAQQKSLRGALEKCAAALAASTDERDTIKFTGKWAALGSMTVGAILDEANSALEPST